MQANNSKILKKVQYIAFILCKIQFKQKKPSMWKAFLLYNFNMIKKERYFGK